MSGSVTSNQVDMEGDDIAGSVGLQVVCVVIELVAATGIDVALVAGIGNLGSLLDGPSDIYQDTVSV